RSVFARPPQQEIFSSCLILSQSLFRVSRRRQLKCGLPSTWPSRQAWQSASDQIRPSTRNAGAPVSVGRSVKVRIAPEELMVRAGLPGRADDEEVGELRGGDESGGRLEAERGGVRRRHCHDAIMLKLAVRAPVADVEVRLVFRERPADRRDYIIQTRIRLAYFRSQEKGVRDEGLAPEEIAGRAMKLIRAGRRDRVVDDA